jgi:phage shock protein E
MGFLSSLWGGGPSVDAQRVREVLAAGAKVVDVRTPEEFASGHVPGAVNIPVQSLGARLSEVGPKHEPVVLYCRSGARSGSAASMLRNAGWAEVLDVGPMSAFPR